MNTQSPEIHILSLEEAIAYQPDKPTYAIRIFSPSADHSLYPLDESGFYTVIREYFFDDTLHDMLPTQDPETEEIYKPFTPEIAHTIISDFEESYRSEDLMIHCTYGMNRSPAIAIALNDIFNLGSDSGQLQQEFMEYREWIYELMIERTILDFPYLLEGRRKQT